ncbi:MAG: hypothetical protein FD175_934 [Beijerinckiaceae bacterium]|nr:MAG: hypothetical protein FD175_934 [Beijerinckiaceae bacterium]
MILSPFMCKQEAIPARCRRTGLARRRQLVLERRGAALAVHRKDRKYARLKHDLANLPTIADDTGGQGAICLGRRRRIGVLGWCSISLGVIIAVSFAVVGLFIWTIQREKNSAFLRQHFVELLTTGLGPSNKLVLDEAGVRFSGVNPTFSVGGLAISNPETGAQAELDKADFALSNLSLWRLSPEAKSIRFEGLRLILPHAAGAENALEANEALTLLRATLAAVNFAVSGQDPAFRTLKTIEGRGISILRRNRDGGTDLVHSGMTASVTRDGEAGITARVRKADQSGGVDLVARTTPTADGGQAVNVEALDLTVGGLLELTGARLEGVDPASRVLLRLNSKTSAEKTLLETGVSVAVRGGHIVPTDRDMVPFDLDEAALDLRMRAGAPEVLIDRLQVRFNETNILARGTLSPVEGAGGGIRLRLQAERAELDRLTAGEAPLALDTATLEGVIAPNMRSFALDRLEIREDEGMASLSGRFSLENDGLIETRVEARTFDLRKALRVWPIWVASNIRRWLLAHAESGQMTSLSLQTSLSGEALQDAFNHRPIPDQALKLTYRLDGVRLKPVLDAAALNGLSAAGVSSGRRADIEIERGWVEPAPGQRFDIMGAKLLVANTALRPALLEMAIPAQGRLDGLLTFLSAPSLKNLVGLPPDAAVTEGIFQGQAQIALPISANPQARDTRVDIRAETKNVVIDNIVKGERLEGGAFSFVSKSGVVTGKGEGRIAGVVNQIEFRTDAAKNMIATVKVQLDEAILVKRGIDLRPAVAGPIGATFTLPLGKTAPVEVDLDLAKTRIETGIPGIGKRAGQAGRAKFALNTRQEGTSLDGFELDFGTIQMRGRIELLRDGQFGKADLGQFKVSAGDNAKLMIDRTRGVLRVGLQGNAFDLRPFMRGFQGGKIEDGKSGDGKGADFDLDLQTTVLVGFNGELMNAADVKASRRQGRITQLALRGQFGGAPITAKSGDNRGEFTAILADSADAGALMRFLDIYARMLGGRLAAELLVGAQTQQGVVQVRDFLIRGEPSLRQVGAASRTSQGQPIVNDEVQFTKLRADFARRPGRLELKEAVMWGAQIGGTLEGTLDYASDQVSLKGVFVPAYALNNFFASVPLLGPILGGSQYEGLFAVPFVITGKASAPVFRTNPISVIAPGFLRKIFEIRRAE